MTPVVDSPTDRPLGRTGSSTEPAGVVDPSRDTAEVVMVEPSQQVREQYLHRS